MSAEQRMPELRPLTDEERQFIHYNPNTSDLEEWIHTYAREYAAQQTEALRAERQQAIDALQRLSDFCKLMRMPWDQAAEAEINAVKVLESLKQEKL